MSNQSLAENVNELNQLILQGQVLEAFEKFYDQEVVMQDNEADLRIGKDVCRSYEEAFVNGLTAFRGAAVKQVMISDNLAVVEWDFDYTHKDWGDRKYTQLAVQRWNDEGKIVNEKFYYNT
ncbi:MAG: nuclear transport factor 2 family protein [Bacteroidota bacterium]